MRVTAMRFVALFFSKIEHLFALFETHFDGPAFDILFDHG
jgi:hypothetical protein